MITLYHGTSIKNADIIMKKGFVPRINKGNWDEKYLSKKSFVYFTSAYPFFYGGNAAEEKDEMASVIKIEVDEEYLYPDEDFIIQAGKLSEEAQKILDIENYKHYGIDSLNGLGNVAIKDLDKIKILDRKDFKISEMCMWCDPSMSIINFYIMGKYYEELTNNWFEGKNWKIDFEEYLNKTRKEKKYEQV